MGFEEKTLDLLALLTAHVGGSSPAVPVVTRPHTPTPTHTSSVEAIDKKRKRVHGGKGPKGNEEGEITQSSHQPLAKEARIGRGQQKKTSVGIARDGGDRSKKPAIWRPLFTLNSGNLVLNDGNLRDP